MFIKLGYLICIPTYMEKLRLLTLITPFIWSQYDYLIESVNGKYMNCLQKLKKKKIKKYDQLMEISVFYHTNFFETEKWTIRLKIIVNQRQNIVTQRYKWFRFHWTNKTKKCIEWVMNPQIMLG